MKQLGQNTQDTEDEIQIQHAPGRSCPINYRYESAVFKSPPPSGLLNLEVLYVVGGLYGNDLALDEVLRLFDKERGRKCIVFNGDFHWFDVRPEVFSRIQDLVLDHTALRGNVETELGKNNAKNDFGCGCAYPDWIDDETVQRSNRIFERISNTPTYSQRLQLRSLPMWQVATVGPSRVGLVHGDPQSLAGWGFAQENLKLFEHLENARSWFKEACIDIFACTHTCLPVFQQIQSSKSGKYSWILNNGSAGMPNFFGDKAGLLTRVALTPFEGSQKRCGVIEEEIFMDLIGIEFDFDESQRRFRKDWPEGSDAYKSYFTRLTEGPKYNQNQVVRFDLATNKTG